MLNSTYVLSIVLLASTGSGWAQLHSPDEAMPSIVLRPAIPAYFAGCNALPEGTDEKLICSGEQLHRFIADELVYPAEALENRIEGVVMLSFIIDAKGKVGHVRVLRDIGGGCGAEAARVVSAMPRWQPAISKGAIVATQFTLPVTFGLKTGMFDYVLHVGELEEGEFNRKTIVEQLCATAPRVTNPKGEEMLVTEVVYTFERGGERRQHVVRGSEAPEAEQLSKFLGRKPGRLTVDANVVDGLDIRTVGLSFSVVR